MTGSVTSAQLLFDGNAANPGLHWEASESTVAPPTGCRLSSRSSVSRRFSREISVVPGKKLIRIKTNCVPTECGDIKCICAVYDCSANSHLSSVKISKNNGHGPCRTAPHFCRPLPGFPHPSARRTCFYQDPTVAVGPVAWYIQARRLRAIYRRDYDRALIHLTDP